MYSVASSGFSVRADMDDHCISKAYFIACRKTHDRCRIRLTGTAVRRVGGLRMSAGKNWMTVRPVMTGKLSSTWSSIICSTIRFPMA